MCGFVRARVLTEEAGALLETIMEFYIPFRWQMGGKNRSSKRRAVEEEKEFKDGEVCVVCTERVNGKWNGVRG